MWTFTNCQLFSRHNFLQSQAEIIHNWIHPFISSHLHSLLPRERKNFFIIYYKFSQILRERRWIIEYSIQMVFGILWILLKPKSVQVTLTLTSFRDVPSDSDWKPTVLTGEPYARFTTALLWSQFSCSLSHSWLWPHWPAPFSWNSSRCVLPQSIRTHSPFCLENSSCRCPHRCFPPFPEKPPGPPYLKSRPWYPPWPRHTLPNTLPCFIFHHGPYHYWVWLGIYLFTCSLIDFSTGISSVRERFCLFSSL